MESIFILISIAAFYDLEIMKVDITAAYLNTPMNDNITHKWLMLDKDVASVLMSMDENYWKQFLRKDGKILVELDKIMYGFKEAAYWWNVTLVNTFLANGYKQMSKDKCLMVKSEGNKVSYCAITVDDCFFVTSRDPEWAEMGIKMLQEAFEEVTVERGDVINILGMTVTMDRVNKAATIKQQHFVDKITSTFDITKKAVTPAYGDLQ